MHLRITVACLDRKRLSAGAIQNDIVVRLEPNIMGSITAACSLHGAKFRLLTQEASDADDRKPTNNAHEAILSALNKSPFSSVRKLSRLAHLPPTTVYRRLSQFLGFTALHLRWLPHALLEAQKAQGVTLFRKRLRMLEVQHDRAWRGFHLINLLEKERKFNAMHDLTETLSPLSEWLPSDASENDRKLMVHANNTRPHTARFQVEFFEDNRMKMPQHPPSSTDIAPSDLFPCRYVKGCLAGRSFVNGEEPVEAIRGILDSIEKATLHNIFLAWMDRLRKCIQTNGQHTR
jgi:hypothetical protein